jgi:hypothetical protein
MQFLSADNYHVLLSLVKEHITTDVSLFDNMFNDFGSREKGPVLDLNKRFIRILNDMIKNNPKTRKVSFDQQCDTHKQNFLSYAVKPPQTPVFADSLSDKPLKNIDDLVKDTIASRQYEIAPSGRQYEIAPSGTQPIKPIPIKDPVMSKKILDIQPTASDELDNPFLKLAIDLSEPEECSKYTPSNWNPQQLMQMIYTLETKLDMVLSKLSTINEK